MAQICRSVMYMVREQERQLRGTKKTAVWIIWIVQVVQFLVTVNLEIAEFVNLVFRVLSYVPTEQARERDPGWVWSRVSRKKLILREEPFVSLLCVWLIFTHSCNDHKNKIDLLTLQL